MNNTARMIILGLLVLFFIVPVAAQGSVMTWSPPELVVQVEGEAPVGSMALVADDRGYLHWFYAHIPNEDVAAGIDYVWWNGETWSEPVNIMVNRDGSGASNVRAAIDAEQNIHLLWGGGLNTLYYATTSAKYASSPSSWSVPVGLVSAVGESDIVVASNNAIHVVYIDPDSHVVNLISSYDGAENWNTPVSIAASSAGSIARDVRIAVDTAGRQHVVWSEVQLPEGWPPTGIFYANSTDGGLNWGLPVQVAGFGYSQIGVATVGKDEVHLFYPSSTALQDAAFKGNYHLWSADGGITWSVPERAIDKSGLSGLPSFATDAIGQLHIVTSQAYYVVWDGTRLGDYQDIATSELRAQSLRSSGERAVGAITLGNTVHVVFETDFKYLWHTSRRLDIPPLSIPTPDSTVTVPPTQTVISDLNSDHIISTPTPAISISPLMVEEVISPIALLTVSVLPVMLIVSIVILKNISRKKS